MVRRKPRQKEEKEDREHVETSKWLLFRCRVMQGVDTVAQLSPATTHNDWGDLLSFEV